MNKKTIPGVVKREQGFVLIDFVRAEITMEFSRLCKIQRELKLKEGDKVKVTIEKVL